MDSEFGALPGFRLRGREISRMEGFSDSVFAFALTLLVVSLEAPKTYDQLMGIIRGLPAFAVCFLALVYFWMLHYQFFRRYGLVDITIVLLNTLLMFVVLFYVYPLKFLFTIMMGGLFGFRAIDSGGSAVATITAEQGSQLLVLYGIGFAAMFWIISLMYLHAWRRREALELTPVECFDTWFAMARFMAVGGVGVLSILIALSVSPRYIGLAGLCYFSIGIIETVFGTYCGKRRERLLEPRTAP